MTNAYLKFKENTVTSDLSCTNTTDQFSISNNNAKLTYKVGLVSSPEMRIIYNTNALKTGYRYILASPNSFDSDGRAVVKYVESDGLLASDYVSFVFGVRPAVSLIPGIEFSSGDGSMASPYVVSTN
jgi:hypothetical protein